MRDESSGKRPRRFLRADFFMYMAKALQPKRRRMVLYTLVGVTLVSGFFDTLRWPVLDTLSILGASATCVYIGYLLLTVLPSGWELHAQYRLVALWLIAVGIGVPVTLLIVGVLP